MEQIGITYSNSEVKIVYTNQALFLLIFVLLLCLALHNLIRYCQSKLQGQASNLLPFFYGILLLLLVGRITIISVGVFAFFHQKTFLVDQCTPTQSTVSTNFNSQAGPLFLGSLLADLGAFIGLSQVFIVN